MVDFLNSPWIICSFSTAQNSQRIPRGVVFIHFKNAMVRMPCSVDSVIVPKKVDRAGSWARKTMTVTECSLTMVFKKVRTLLNSVVDMRPFVVQRSISSRKPGGMRSFELWTLLASSEKSLLDNPGSKKADNILRRSFDSALETVAVSKVRQHLSIRLEVPSTASRSPPGGNQICCMLQFGKVIPIPVPSPPIISCRQQGVALFGIEASQLQRALWMNRCHFLGAKPTFSGADHPFKPGTATRVCLKKWPMCMPTPAIKPCSPKQCFRNQ